MGKQILKTNIKREPTKLYYCSTDKSDGCITVNEAVMSRGGRPKKSKK